MGAGCDERRLKDAVAAGVKVILYNAGDLATAKEVGAMNYVGSDEYVAGRAAGEYFAAKGLKNVLCVNHVPGSVPLQRRCQGVADAIVPLGGKSTELPLPPAKRRISGLPPSTSLAVPFR